MDRVCTIYTYIIPMILYCCILDCTGVWHAIYLMLWGIETSTTVHVSYFFRMQTMAKQFSIQAIYRAYEWKKNWTFIHEHILCKWKDIQCWVGILESSLMRMYYQFMIWVPFQAGSLQGVAVSSLVRTITSIDPLYRIQRTVHMLASHAAAKKTETALVAQE